MYSQIHIKNQDQTQDPLIKYKEYHKDPINIAIHQACVPLILATAYAGFLTPNTALALNIFYSLNYLLFDVFSQKSINCIGYLQVIYGLSVVQRSLLSQQTNIIIHLLSWALQIYGHKVHEKNSPAFLDNLYDSFLFAPYFTFLETFYPNTMKDIQDRSQQQQQQPQSKYIIVKKINSNNAKNIIYFAGLFQKADKHYAKIAEQLPEFNHIFVNVFFENGDYFKDTLTQIYEELNPEKQEQQEQKEQQKQQKTECIIGFSFGGSLAKQYKEIIFDKEQIYAKCILISPGGFRSNTFCERFITTISQPLYKLYNNAKWYMISNYPIYQNYHNLTINDYLIHSTNDQVHNPAILNDNEFTSAIKINLKYASHKDMLLVVQKQKIIQQLLQNDYNINELKKRSLTPFLSKILFGGHFYPYHIGLWITVSAYNLYSFIVNHYSPYYFATGFIFASTIWSFTEYAFHRFILHKFFGKHHNKHHDYPNKLSIIHTPMSLVVLNWFVYYFLLQQIQHPEQMTSYCIFFPLNYLAFEYIHLLSHSYVGKNKVILNAKQYHKLHHLTPNTNYSFVTPFWDYFFRTLSPNYKIQKEEILFGFIPFYSFLFHKVHTKTQETQETQENKDHIE